MGEICGVCSQNESKYKCPSCQVRYCSIACFKQHKETHANDPPKEKPAPAQPIAAETTTVPTTTRNALPGSTKKVDFTNFESDPELLRLLSRYPNLRIQLQSVYGLTLEPPPQEQPSSPIQERASHESMVLGYFDPTAISISSYIFLSIKITP
ncbi:hypothetical protein D6C83_08111 [Aureobasidium pullulans]|uniref:HIT-type domain-containing protein n=1 Tax=Aureobasidium pullulans TaxID=5580 RepID=A0A4T0AN08_AURPU|nr:hypothetical protein D6C83_08111 [Aureobasidium pullulans]